MRRVVLFGLLLSLAGCSGFGDFLSDTHTFRNNPNMPPGDSENLKRVIGEEPAQQALTPEPGNIWPPPVGPMPTLMDLESQNGQNMQNPVTPPAVGSGGSLPPVPQGGLGAEAPMATPRATVIPGIGPQTRTPPPSNTAPPAYQTPRGTAPTANSGPGYSTVTTPGGGQSIVVPNGNGTSTIIHPDGTVETVPTPK
jgi:hypothetical protein